MGVVGQAWTAAVVRLGGDPGRAAADLDARYAEPHRTYHDAAHVEAVLRHVEVLAGQTGLDDTTCTLVVLAACAHDVVHDGRPDDEERSADWARAQLAAAGVDPGLIDRVRDLVLATATHASTGDPAADVLCDADLAVLGGPADEYARYVAAVRAEYAEVSDEQWRTGRTEVMTALLALPRLYATEPARERWEAAARVNVLDELRTLER
jgi:predicted metal-dependent HD superfamily phosphohydrolase